MIQDIAPSKLDNAYHAYMPGADDFLMIFDPDGKLLVSSEKDHLGFPTFARISSENTVYLYNKQDKSTGY